MDKKQPKKKEDMHKDAKMSVLSELRDMAMGMMGEKADKYSQDPADIAKVEVESRGPGDKSQGIELMAQKLPGQMGRPGSGIGEGKGMDMSSDSSLGSDGDMNEDMEASENHSMDYEDDMSDAEIDSIIAELQLKKSSRSPKA